MSSSVYTYSTESLAAAESAKTIEAAKAAAKGSPITALAIILASVATKMTDNLMELATKIGAIKDDKANEIKNGTPAGEVGDKNETVLTALLQADTQKMSMFMQAMNNAIKTLGEAETAVARKG